MEKETIDGFLIEKRPMTEEELLQDITYERFENYYLAVGEDFVDQHSGATDELVFLGFCIAKHPKLSLELLECYNGDIKYFELLTIETFFEENFDEDGFKLFYSLLAEFLNLTNTSKRYVNEILIRVDEYYSRQNQNI